MPDQTVEIGGRKVKKEYVYFAVAGAGVIVVAVYRSKKAAAGTSDASGAPVNTSYGSTQYPPDGTSGDPSNPFSLDPATGMTYGDEQGSGFGGYGGSSYGGYGGGSAYTGYYGPSGIGTSTTPTFTDNASWAQYAENYLVGLGDDPNSVGNALGKYITGQSVDGTQQSLIQQAIAFANMPPVSGSGGFPPSIKLSPTTTTPPPASDKVKVPNVVGKNYEAAADALRAAHLVPHRGQADVGQVTSQAPHAGSEVKKGSTVTLKGTGNLNSNPGGPKKPKTPVKKKPNPGEHMHPGQA